MSVRIVIDDNQLREVQARLGELQHKAPNAIANALNRAVTNVKSNVSKEIRQRYHVKAGDIKETLKIFKANTSKLQGEVKSSGKTLGLEKFKVSPKTVNPKRKSQLKIAIKKSGTKQILGAFVASINGIKITKREGKQRLPIARLMGPSVPQMIGNEQSVNKVNQEAKNTYENRINHEINRLLSQMGAS